jgi:hypothetical protein
MSFFGLFSTEIETRLQRELQEILRDKPELVEESKSKMVAALAADASWVEPYLFAAELSIPGLDLDSIGGDVGAAIKDVLGRLKKASTLAGDEHGTWQKLTIPVDLPFMHVSTDPSGSVLPSPASYPHLIHSYILDAYI